MKSVTVGEAVSGTLAGFRPGQMEMSYVAESNNKYNKFPSEHFERSQFFQKVVFVDALRQAY